MKWNETTASKCRYSEVAEKIWGDAEILAEVSENDYQGSVVFVARHGRNKYSFYEYSYGSRSGCDSWESANLSDDQIEKEMRDTSVWFGKKADMVKYLQNIIDDNGGSKNPSYHPDNYVVAVEAMKILQGGSQ